MIINIYIYILYQSKLLAKENELIIYLYLGI